MGSGKGAFSGRMTSSGKGGSKKPPLSGGGGKPGLRSTPFQKPIVRKLGRGR